MRKEFLSWAANSWCAGRVFCALMGSGIARADVVALWLFDEPVAARAGAVLEDAGPREFRLVLGRAGEIVPGRFGHALRVLPFPIPGRTPPARSGDDARFAAIFPRDDAPLNRTAWANATDSALNLGAQDWTIECWLRLDAGVGDEGTLFEIGSGPRGGNELVTRFTVLPREDAFAFTGRSTARSDATDPAARRVDYPNPGGPPASLAFFRTHTLALARGSLPRDVWVHVALVHRADVGELQLFLDGKRGATAAAEIGALPHGDEAYVLIGRDGRGERPLAGAIDELRVSDCARYAGDFVPPASFSRRSGGAAADASVPPR